MAIDVVSLFSGGGGLDLGFKSAGFNIIWAIDNNQNAGSTDRGGGTDLLYFETFETLANKYKSVPLDEGVRVAKSDDFELYKGTNKFINFNNLSNSLSISIINDFIPLQRKSGKQQRTVKSVAEWNKIFRTKGRAQFPENSVLVPTKIRKSGRIHLARIPLHVSSNFTVFSYENAETAEIIASYMTTVFYREYIERGYANKNI